MSSPMLRRRQVFVDIKDTRPSGEKHKEESSVVARSRRRRLVLCRERGRALQKDLDTFAIDFSWAHLVSSQCVALFECPAW